MSHLLKSASSVARRLLPALLVVAVLDARAFEIPMGSDDVQMRWDNTLRYTYAHRVQGQNPEILANLNADDGDRNFAHGTISDRLDLLSEFDVSYKQAFAVRFSGAGWYDDAYAHQFRNTSVASSNHLENGQPASGLSQYARHYFKGPYGELLDAFALAKVSIGEVPFVLRAGRHTEYWGESLLLGGAVQGVSYAQMPIDVAKGLAVPGAEVKELFRPLNNLSLQTQPFENFALAAQYFLDWEPYRVPEDGTYLGFNDALLGGGESVILTSGVRAVRGADIEARHRGNWGLSARWSPEWLDATVGVYHREFSDMLPQAFVVPDVAALTANNCGSLTAPSLCATIGTYGFNYPGGIKLNGISLAKNIAGVSVAAEFNYRANMPLSSEAPVVVPQALPPAVQSLLNNLLHQLHQTQVPPGLPSVPSVVIAALPTSGGAVGATGDTMHGLVNALGLIDGLHLFGLDLIDSISYQGEFTWSRWVGVKQNESLFKGRSDYTALDRVSRDNFAIGVNLTPIWFQVLPAMDLSLPLSYSQGLKGNSAVQFGGNAGAGLYSGGVAADFFAKYHVDLKYAGFFGEHTTSSGAANVFNGATAALADRGFVALTLKTAF